MTTGDCLSALLCYLVKQRQLATGIGLAMKAKK